jgi:hypothetical protein
MFDSWQKKYFFLLHFAQTESGAHPASNPQVNWSSHLGLKWPRRETDYSPPISGKTKNM